MSQIKVSSDHIADAIISLRLLLEKCRDQSQGHGCFNHPLDKTSGKFAEMLNNLTQELDITKNRIDCMIESGTIAMLADADSRFRAADEAMRDYFAAGGAKRSHDFHSNSENRIKVINVAKSVELRRFKDWALNPDNWTNRPGGAPWGIDVDKAHGEQCADIPKAYYQQLFGDLILLTAWYENPEAPISRYDPGGWFSGSIPSGLQDVSNGGNVREVKAGDIVFISGHVMVATSDSDTNGNFSVIEQNPTSPRESSYNISRAIGCFRPTLW
jgi:hypothetical protein